MHNHRCPTCGRKFKHLRDYPRVLVLSFERLPIPEAIDQLSAEAAQKWLARRRRAGGDAGSSMDEGINRTPEIAAAVALAEVQAYLDNLAQLAGQTVSPQQFSPPFEPSSRFKFAHPIPGTKLFLSLTEGEPLSESERVVEIEVYCHGPNMGSAGGPTLLALGLIARLRYQGLLL